MFNFFNSDVGVPCTDERRCLFFRCARASIYNTLREGNEDADAKFRHVWVVERIDLVPRRITCCIMENDLPFCVVNNFFLKICDLGKQDYL